MKKCPFCAELIQDEAIKCRHCSEFLDGATIEERRRAQGVPMPNQNVRRVPKEKWFHSPLGMIVALGTMGPFALPFVWTHPKYSKTKKIVITTLVSVITILLLILTYYCILNIVKYYQQILKF